MFLWIVIGWILTQLTAPFWVWLLFWIYIIFKILWFICD